MKNKRGKTSWVWDEGYQLIKSPNSKKPEKFWLCRRCYEDNQYVKYGAESTNHAAGHLLEAHELSKQGPVAKNDDNEPSPSSSFCFERFKQLFIRWIVLMHISFSQVENPAFQELLFYLCAVLAGFFPTSGNTVRQWILNDFKRRKDQIKKELHRSKSLIHLSFDLWTSPNSLAMLAVVGHFVSHVGEAKCCLLGLKHVEGSHSGENMAQSVIAVIKEYEITDILGYFVLDNISSNDTCVQEILKQLRPDLNPKQRRLRCFGHIVNLAAKAFLFGEEAEAFEYEVDSYTQRRLEENELKTWRKLGPIGKLHNIVTYIRKTPQRREAFMDISKNDEAVEAKELQVVADNQTRWNSTYLMIKRALKLRVRIDSFIREYTDIGDYSLSDADILSKEDWQTLQTIHDLMFPFWLLTMKLQGNAPSGSYGVIWEILPAMEVLINRLEDASEKYTYKKSKFIHASINNAWLKLRQYYRLLDDSPIYAASLVLNPSIKERYFENKWTGGQEDWISKTKEDVRTFWTTEYKDKVTMESPLPPTTSGEGQNPEFNMFEEYTYGHLAASNAQDEYDAYCANFPLPREPPNLIQYWDGQAATSPSLSRMALDLLSIPAMTAECERVFSSSKILISDRRNRLKDDIIEASECLNHWYRKGYFEYDN
jgi:hypothetical protein